MLSEIHHVEKAEYNIGIFKFKESKSEKRWKYGKLNVEMHEPSYDMDANFHV